MSKSAFRFAPRSAIVPALTVREAMERMYEEDHATVTERWQYEDRDRGFFAPPRIVIREALRPRGAPFLTALYTREGEVFEIAHQTLAEAKAAAAATRLDPGEAVEIWGGEFVPRRWDDYRFYRIGAELIEEREAPPASPREEVWERFFEDQWARRWEGLTAAQANPTEAWRAWEAERMAA